MTPADIRALRLSLGLSTKAFGRALNLASANGGRTVRRWEAGTSIPNGLAMAALIKLSNGDASDSTVRCQIAMRDKS